MTTFKKDHDTEKSDYVLRAGPLKSQLQLESYTDFAIQLWNGRKMNAKKHPKNEGHFCLRISIFPVSNRLPQSIWMSSVERLSVNLPLIIQSSSDR